MEYQNTRELQHTREILTNLRFIKSGINLRGGKRERWFIN